MWSNEGSAEQPSGEGVGAAIAPSAGTAVAVTPPPAPIIIPDGAFDVPPTLGERIELCRFLAEANLLPQALRKQPANVLLIMHKALALNLPLSVALEHLHVIDGKVGHSAELLRGLLARAGHILRWVEITDKAATGELVLKHDPRNPRKETFTIADATRMKLTGKDNWSKDPASMLVARVTTRLVSRHCPEIAVALGNLSAIDMGIEDEATPPEPVQATAEAAPSLEAQAADLYELAQGATTSAELKEIGRRAKDDGLLDIAIDPDRTLQQALLQRIDEIGKDRKPATAAETAGRSGGRPE